MEAQAYDSERRASQVLAPVMAVVIDGKPVPGLCSLSTVISNYSRADSFEAEFALEEMAKDGLHSLAYWADLDPMLVKVEAECSMGYLTKPGDYSSASFYTPQVIGYVDDVEIDIDNKAIKIKGRDLSSLLIDAKVTDKFTNKKASDIATLFALEHGLTPNVTATSKPIGLFSNNEDAAFSHEVSEWSFLTKLAQGENYDLYVTGRTLYFGPKPDPANAPKVRLVYTPGSDKSLPAVYNANRLVFRRSYLSAKDVIVKVTSFDPNTGARISYSATSYLTKRGSAGSKAGVQAQTYTFELVARTKPDLIKFAQAKLEEITRHEREIDCTSAGLEIKHDTIITLSGTSTTFDTDYFTDSVSHKQDEHGWETTVRAKNHSTRSQVELPN